MSHRSRLRLLADYMAATRNEIAVDEMFLSMARVRPEQVGYLPRVPRWVVYATRFPALTRTASLLGRLMWLAGGAIAFFLLEYLKFVKLQRQGTSSASMPALTEGAVLGFSTRVCDVVHPAQFAGMPNVWVTIPWAPQHVLPPEAVERPLLTLLDRSDLRRAFVDAVTVNYALHRHAAFSKWVLQGYTAFRWFLTRQAVDRVLGKHVMVEHFDRWAVLADRSMRARRRCGALEQEDRLVLIQHGALGGLGDATRARDSHLHLPIKLQCVDELYAYNPMEEALFRASVLSMTPARRPLQVNYFKPAIALSGDASSPRLRILFVGHPICEQFHMDVYHALREKHSFDAYYKPHPKAPTSAAMGSVGWTIINDPQWFPRVDLLVSYPSTLVIEYEGVGISASVHPISITRSGLTEFLDQTQKLIESRSPLKGVLDRPDSMITSANEAFEAKWQ